MSDDEVADLRRQWLADLQREREGADDVALIEEWKAAAEVLRPSRHRSQKSAIPSQPKRRAIFVQALEEHFGDVPVPVDALGKAAENWEHICHGNVAVARSWWLAGMNPFDDRAWDLALAGVRPSDLGLVWDGKTLLQHFFGGVEARQCALWALFLRPRRSEDSA